MSIQKFNPPVEIASAFSREFGMDLEYLQSVKMPVGDKAAGCSALIKQLEHEAKLMANAAKELRAYLAQKMGEVGIKHAGNDDHRLEVIPNLHVEIVNESEVPEQFLVDVPATRKIDKRAIAAWVRETGEVPAGIHVEKRFYIRAK